MKKFTADFETATWIEDETYVWAWAICDIETEKIEIGNNIDTFMEYCKTQKNATFYFHNLKFDGSFVLHYLLSNGFRHVEKKEDIEDNTFTTLISDMGVFYQITVYYKKGNKEVHKTTFIDSLKIIPFSVEETAKCYNLPISKLELDYNKPREIGYILSKEEEDYIKNDVLIIAKALKIMFQQNLTKMTRASCALADYKEIITKYKFMHYFPLLDFEVDEDLRKAYKRRFYLFKPYI